MMNINSLSDEILVHIFNFTRLKDKRNARLVCTRWKSIIETHVVRIIYEIWHNQERINSLLSSNKIFDVLNLYGCDESLTLPSITVSRNKFPEIREIVLGHGNSEKATLYVLKYGCIKSQYLKITAYGLMFHQSSIRALKSMLPVINWNSMTKLDIEVASIVTGRRQFTTITILLKLAKIPNLNNFKINVEHTHKEEEVVLINLCIEYCHFLVRHKDGLRELHTNFKTNYAISDISKKINFVCPQLNLEIFIFRLNNSASGLRVFAVDCMSGLQNLKHFSFSEYMPDTPVDAPLSIGLEETLRRNESTLKILKLCLPTINTSWFLTCTSVKTMNLYNFQTIENTVGKSQTFYNITLLTLGRTQFDHIIVTWIIKTMPNLIQLFLEECEFDVEVLKIIINLKSLLKIHFHRLTNEYLYLVREYCNTHKLMFKEQNNSYNYCGEHRRVSYNVSLIIIIKGNV